MFDLRKIAVIWVLLTIPMICYAQAPDIEWEFIIGDPATGDYGRGAFQTDDGGYVVGGNYQTWAGGYFGNVIFKLDADGDTVWSHLYGMTEERESASMFRLCPDGSYMFGGSTDMNENGSLGYLYKINPDGSYDWGCVLGDPFIGEYVSCFAPLGSDQAVAMTGFWYDSDYGYDTKLHFIAPGGDPAWDIHYFTHRIADYANCIQLVSDGGYIIAGSTQDTATFDIQMLLMKTSPLGNIEHWGTIGGSFVEERAYWVIQTEDGGYLLTGFQKNDDNYTKDVFIVKTNSAYQSEWWKTYGMGYMEEGRYCAQTEDGGYVVGANCSYNGTFNFWLLRLDANGDTLWTKVVDKTGTDESIYSVDICDDGGYILCGNIHEPGENCDIYAVKLGPETSVDGYRPNLPATTALSQNYPNPFNAKTTISFTLDKPQHASLKIYDLLGREIETLIDDNLDAGEHSVIFDAKGLASGTYLYNLTTDSFTEHKRMLLIK